ncbi:hypothetical protein ACP0I7_27635 [Pseudomonas aeruginosa]
MHIFSRVISLSEDFFDVQEEEAKAAAGAFSGGGESIRGLMLIEDADRVLPLPHG